MRICSGKHQLLRSAPHDIDRSRSLPKRGHHRGAELGDHALQPFTPCVALGRLARLCVFEPGPGQSVVAEHIQRRKNRTDFALLNRSGHGTGDVAVRDPPHRSDGVVQRTLDCEMQNDPSKTQKNQHSHRERGKDGAPGLYRPLLEHGHGNAFVAPRGCIGFQDEFAHTVGVLDRRHQVEKQFVAFAVVYLLLDFRPGAGGGGDGLRQSGPILPAQEVIQQRSDLDLQIQEAPKQRLAIGQRLLLFIVVQIERERGKRRGRLQDDDSRLVNGGAAPLGEPFVILAALQRG